MRYFYQKPEIGKPEHGRRIPLDHPAYKFGTLFTDGDRGLILVQMRFELNYAYWDAIDFWLANDIYEHPKFPEWFSMNATESDYPIFQVRSVMWTLRMKPLPKAEWERYF